MTINVRPLGNAVGAEITGVDLAEDLGNAEFAAIRDAFHAHGVIFFRDQRLSPRQHVAFARRFGPININRFFQPVEGHPEIAEVRKEPHHQRNIGAGWHTDHSYDEAPALGSMLYAHEVPTAGGDTLFAGMASAFEALSDGLKAKLRTLAAKHSSRHVFGAKRYIDEPQEYQGRLSNPELATQDAVHPLVIKHPQTGRETLYVNPGFTLGIEGFSDQESKALLDFLYAHAVKPEFTCRFQWQVGSVALWDNRATWHRAVNDYPGQRRYMHRVTIEGGALTAAA